MNQNENPEVKVARAIVTGGSSGIGFAVARRLTDRGASVAVIGRDRGRLDRAISRLGNGSVAVQADVSDAVGAEGAIASAIDALGGVDLLVNCAADLAPLRLADLDTANWDRMIATNLSGTFHACKIAGLAMWDAGGGSIINVASEAAFVGMPRFVAYSASKAGVIGLTKALAVELVPRVRVNAICPGPVDTPMLRRNFASAEDPQGVHDDTLARTPIGRFATPEEIADAIVFLGVDAGFATGSVWILDGGITMV